MVKITKNNKDGKNKTTVPPSPNTGADVILEAMIDGVAMIDVAGNIIKGNTAFARMHGYAKIHEMIGKNIISLTRPDDVPKAGKAIREILKTGNIQGFRFTALTKKKGEFPVELSGTVLKNPNGDTVGLIGVLRDISELTKAYVAVAELKKAEEEVKTSEEKFKALVESSPDCIKLFATTGKLLYMSPSGLKEHRLKSPTDAIGWDYRSSVVKSQRPAIIKAFTGAVSGETVTLEVDHVPEKATRECCLVTFAPVKDKNGQVIAVYGVSRDLTVLKKAQKHIVQFAKNTQKNIDHIIPILQTVAMGDFSRIIKIPKKEDEFTELLVALKLMIDDLQGTEKKVIAHEQKLKNANFAIKNVLDDLQLERSRLADAKAKQEALLASIGEGVVATDENGRIILMNHAAEQMLDLLAKQAMGQVIFEAWKVFDEKGNFVPEAARPITRALQGKITTTTTTGPSFLYARNNGTTFPVAIAVTPVIVNNKIIGAIEAFHDITREREVDRTKSEFVSLASHQLRTPTTAINWYSEMLMEEDVGTLNAKQKEYLREIYHGNHRMIDLVNQLLSVSRIELGTFMIKPAPVDTTTIIDDVLQELKTTIQEGKLTVAKKYAPGAPIIESDKNLIRIVIQNLLTNAVAYTPAKGKITISVTPTGAGIRLTVKDNGVGIPPTAQVKIFTKFFRADNARIFKPDGNGLGLYMSKKITAALSGTISFTSTVGIGTTFVVDLPRRGVQKKESNKRLTW